MKYNGSCHCGKIAFEVEGEIQSALACNCSICSKMGSLLWFVPRDHFKLSMPASDMSTYLFNKHVIQHHFCPTCGIHPFAEGKDPKGNAMAAVNLRCLDGVDLDKIPVNPTTGGRSSRLSIEGAHHAAASAIEDVRIDHRGAHVLVAEKLLHRADVVAGFHEVGGEGVAQGVRGDGLLDARPHGGIVNGTLQALFRPASRVTRQSVSALSP